MKLLIKALLLAILILFIGIQGSYSKPLPHVSKGNLDNDILYYISVDRFFDGESRNNIPNYAFSDHAQSDFQENYNQINRSLIQHTYDPTHRYPGMYWGGDLKGIIQKLDYLQDLGVTKLILSPIQDHANGVMYDPGRSWYLHTSLSGNDAGIDPFYAGISTSFQGHWTKDWYELDEHFRDPTDDETDRLGVLANLLDKAAARGIGVLLEMDLNSTSPVRSHQGYEPFQLQKSEQWLIDNGAIYRHGQLLAPYIDPLTLERDPAGWFHKPLEINYSHVTQNMLEQGQVDQLPDLNQDIPEVRSYLLEAIRFWLTFNQQSNPIAGFYFNDIPHIPLDFWKDLESVALSIDPDVMLISHYSGAGYTNRKAIKWYTNTDAYTWVNYSFSFSTRHFFERFRNWDGRTYVLRENILGQKGQYFNYSPAEKILHRILNPSESLEIPRSSLRHVQDQDARGWINFIEHPDQPRLLSQRPKVSDQAYASLLKFLFASPGVPMLLYGTETNLAVPYHIDHQGRYGVGGFPFNLPMMIWPGEPGWNQELFDLTRQLTHLRQQMPVLRYGSAEFLFPAGSRRDSDLFMLRRYQDCDPSRDCSAVLFAYSTFGGNFSLSPNLKGVTEVINLDNERVTTGEAPQFCLTLQPEESRILILKT
jgi:glycosidase